MELEQVLLTIDAKSGWVRSKFITISPGQEATYLLKFDDAKSYKAAGYPADVTPYPMIAAEAMGRSVTPRVATDVILDEAAAWKGLAALIEGKRMYWKTKARAAIGSNSLEIILNSAVEDLMSIIPH